MNKNDGKKYDDGKNRLDLLPPFALEEIGWCLSHGAKIYGDENWRKVPDLRKRYLGAARRHI